MPASWAVCGGRSTSFDDRVYKRGSPALRLAARAAALWAKSEHRPYKPGASFSVVHLDCAPGVLVNAAPPYGLQLQE